MCEHVCMSVRMCVHMSLYMHMFVHMCVHVSMSVRMCVHMHKLFPIPLHGMQRHIKTLATKKKMVHLPKMNPANVESNPMADKSKS